MNDVRHTATAIVASNDLDASTVFYARLGFAVVSDYDHYRLLSDGRGWDIHLNRAVPGWVVPPHNNAGIYLYADDIDAVAAGVSELIIEPEKRATAKPWGMYEFALSDPDGTLVRIGRPVRAGDV